MSAVCVKCGGFRSGHDQICPACGHRPTGEGLLVGWLLSGANLDDEALRAASDRIRSGAQIRPSGKMLDKARRALGASFATDPGLTPREVLGLLGVNLLITPLVGWVLAVWWRTERPRASAQVLAVTVPCTVLFSALVVWLALRPAT